MPARKFILLSISAGERPMRGKRYRARRGTASQPAQQLNSASLWRLSRVPAILCTYEYADLEHSSTIATAGWLATGGIGAGVCAMPGARYDR